MGDKKEVLEAYCKSLEPGREAGISHGMGLGHPPWGGGGVARIASANIWILPPMMERV